MRLASFFMVAVLATNTATAFAHGLRRTDIVVVDNKLYGQGYLNTSNPADDDGGGLVRPYYNAIHDHWVNQSPAGALATLPGFDVHTPGPLVGSELTLELVGGKIWRDPHATNTPVLFDLEPSDGNILVDYHGDDPLDPFFSTDAPGTFTLLDSVSSTGNTHLDFDYALGSVQPTGVIYALEFKLVTDAPGIADSDPLYVILSPDGSTPAEKLHLESLNLEQWLGIQASNDSVQGAPEPASFAIALAGLACLVLRRSQRRR